MTSSKGFIITSSPTSFLNRNMTILLSILTTFVILLSIGTLFNKNGIILFIILYILIYIILSNLNGNNLSGSLPSTSYPIPPHLGHDGISIENEYI